MELISDFQETLKFYASHLAELTFAKEREKYRKPAETSNDDVVIKPVVNVDEDDDDFGDPDEPLEKPEEIKSPSTPSPKKPEIPTKPKIKPPIAQKPSLSKPVPEVDEEALAAEKLKALQEDSQNKALLLQEKQKELNELSRKINSMRESVSPLKELLQKKQLQLERLKKTHHLLSGDGDGLEKIKSAVEGQVEKLLKLSAQWETHRKPLIDQIRNKQLSSLNGEASQLIPV